MSQDLHIGKSLAALVPLVAGEEEVFVVYDEQVAWVAQEVIAMLPVRAAIGLKTSEELKTMETVLALERRLLEAGATRSALLIAIGGGITTDLAGFTAAIYKRGIRYANIPTTLLSQVDAAIGGKTGVNLDGYKNMLGAFHMPQFTFLCVDVLRTLPPRELRGGLAEMLKTFLIGGADAYAAALRLLTDTPTPQSVPVMQDLVQKAASIKACIVEQDPQEHGERAKLNLGHTFGHAIEHEARLRGDDISHGEAVAMGIILAARLSEAIGKAPKGLASRLKEDFASLGLPTESPYPLETLLAAMHKDKKAVGEKVKFVLLQAPGSVFLQELSPEDAYDCCLHTK